MKRSATMKKILLTLSFTIAISLILIFVLPEKEPYSIDVAEITEPYITIEGYVVSKRMNSIWISEEPKNIGERLTGYFTSYGTGSVLVSKHKEVENENVLSGLKTNQHVRVYGDRLKESNPAKISAYYIEAIDEES